MKTAAVATRRVTKYADMFSAMGTEARLRIMQLLLTAHPEGLVVGEIQEELGIPGSTLSHHLDKLRNEDLVTGAAGEHVLAVHREYGGAAGAVAVLVCGVLHAKSGGTAGGCGADLRVGAMREESETSRRGAADTMFVQARL